VGYEVGEKRLQLRENCVIRMWERSQSGPTNAEEREKIRGKERREESSQQK